MMLPGSENHQVCVSGFGHPGERMRDIALLLGKIDHVPPHGGSRVCKRTARLGDRAVLREPPRKPSGTARRVGRIDAKKDASEAACLRRHVCFGFHRTSRRAPRRSIRASLTFAPSGSHD
jgi:hypothetical protein